MKQILGDFTYCYYSSVSFNHDTRQYRVNMIMFSYLPTGESENVIDAIGCNRINWYRLRYFNNDLT